MKTRTYEQAHPASAQPLLGKQAHARARGQQVDLVAEGVDTVANIFLNDHFVAQTENSHRCASVQQHVMLLVTACQLQEK